MRRVAVILTVVAGAVLVLGLVEDLTNYKWSAGDQNAFFGNQHLLMNDGTSALIVGGILLAGLRRRLGGCQPEGPEQSTALVSGRAAACPTRALRQALSGRAAACPTRALRQAANWSRATSRSPTPAPPGQR